MEGIVFVYIFKVISFAGHLNEYSQFACLLQLIRCFLFTNVNESYARIQGIQSSGLCSGLLFVFDDMVFVIILIDFFHY